jgi:hypothetical protein
MELPGAAATRPQRACNGLLRLKEASAELTGLATRREGPSSTRTSSSPPEALQLLHRPDVEQARGRPPPGAVRAQVGRGSGR